MKLIETGIKDLYIIEPKVFEDQRGYFFESYNKQKYIDAGLNYNFVQDNESKSSYGVCRGLHYQLAPQSQAKLVRVLQGTVLDVVVDLRKNSKTFGESFSVELSDENKRQFIIPRGFAHGFSVLSPSAIFFYKCDNLYNPEYERGINLFDEKLNIDWRIEKEKMILSDRDANLPIFDEAEINF